MVDLSIVIPVRTPDITPIAKSRFDETTSPDFEFLVETDDGRGAAATRNRAIEQAAADKIVFLDDDSDPCPGFLEAVNRSLDDHPIVAGRIIQSGPDLFDDIASESYDQGPEGKPTDIVVGCNMAFRRVVFDSVGLFDESFPYGHEETDLVRRAIDQGFQPWYDPAVCVEHPYADSVREYWHKWWLWGREDVRLHEKHDTPLFDSPLNFVPIAPGSTLQRIAVRSIGKMLRRSRQLITIAGQRL